MKPELALRATGRRMPQSFAWVLGGAFALVFFCRDFLTLSGGIIDHSAYWGRDFINVWTGGHLVREGRLEVLYDLKSYIAYQRTLFGAIGEHNYSYPPVSFPIAALFSLLPYPLALISWVGGTGVLFIHACRRWWPEQRVPAWFAVLTPAALMNVWAGHYGFLVGALFLLGWQSLDKHPRRAGVAFGLMMIKPHLAVLVPIVLAIRREWGALASGAATVAALFAVTILCFGWQPWSDFLFRTTVVQASMIDAGEMFARLLSTSTATALMEFGAGWPLALAGQGIVALLGLALVALAAQRRMPTRELAFLTATCTFLVLPYAFNYDLTVVCVGALALMNALGVRDDDYRLGCYGFLSPQLGMAAACFGAFLMPAMLVGLAVGQFRCWGRRAKRDPEAQIPTLWPEQARAA